MLSTNIQNQQILGQSDEQLKSIFETMYGKGILDDKSFFDNEFKQGISSINTLIQNQVSMDNDIAKVIDDYFFELL